MRLTFEEALNDAMADSNISRFLDDESITLQKLDQDADKVNSVIRNLCKDLSKLLNRNVVQAYNIGFRGIYPITDIDYDLFTKVFQRYFRKSIKDLVNRIKPQQVHARGKVIPTFPIGKISWNDDYAHFLFPENLEKIERIEIKEPKQRSIDEFTKPKHIKKLLDIFEKTHYDYKPYVLTGSDGKKVLACSLGNSLNDFAIARWDHHYTLHKFILFMACCFGISLSGFATSFFCCSGWIASIIGAPSLLVGVLAILAFFWLLDLRKPLYL